MCTRIALGKPTYVRELLYIILAYALNTQIFAFQPAYTSCIHDRCLCNPCIPPENVKKIRILNFG